MTDDLAATLSPFDVQRVRADFPGLQQQVNGKPLVYLDNAATAQVPQLVVDAVAHFHRHDRANVHRGVHALSQRATSAYEAVRGKVRGYLRATDDREIVFTRGATEAINLVAWSFRRRLEPGDEVLVTGMEHHSNIVPWQIVCGETGAKVSVVPVDDRGEIDLGEVEKRITERTKIVSVVHVSNALGTVNPVRDIVQIARSRGVPVLLDGAQAVPHGPVDVQDLGCDFYALSSHKLFGPTGVGVLWGRYELLDSFPPWQGGGDMIRSVSFAGTTFADPPARFEAGTPNIAGVIGFGAALDYLSRMDWPAVKAHEAALLDRATAALLAVPGVRVLGTARHKIPVLSFVMEGAHAMDIGTLLDQQGIAVRTGHHCTQPLMERFGVTATARASFAFYNTLEEADALGHAVAKVARMFR